MPQLFIKLIKMLHEVSVLLLLLAALLLLLALFSFHPADSGWNGVSLPIANNLMGLAGSWLADFIFSLTGMAAWLFVVALVYFAVQLFYSPWQKANWNPFIPSIRCLGFLLLMIGTTALASGHSFAPELPYGAGGILGESLATLVKPLLSPLGVALFFFSHIILGLSLFTGWSWLKIMDEIGYFLMQQAKKITDYWAHFSLSNSPDNSSEVMPLEPNLTDTIELTDNYSPIDFISNKQTEDQLYAAALAFIFESRRASASALQRHFELDYDTAAGLIDRMEKKGLISPPQPNGQRQLLSFLSSKPSNH